MGIKNAIQKRQHLIQGWRRVCSKITAAVEERMASTLMLPIRRAVPGREQFLQVIPNHLRCSQRIFATYRKQLRWQRPRRAYRDIMDWRYALV